jgi:hypothetical protein
VRSGTKIPLRSLVHIQEFLVNVLVLQAQLPKTKRKLFKGSTMEDAKLQALHDTLSQIRGKKGLGTNSQFSWQRGTAGATQTETPRHPAAVHLPDNALYAHFLPEGVYDPNSKAIDYGDGRVVKRDFSDAIMDGDENSNSKIKKRKTKVDKEEKTKQREMRKAEKKAAKKAEKLNAKREAKLEEKKRQKKLEKKLKKDQWTATIASSQMEISQNKNREAAKDTQHILSNEAAIETSKVKGKKKKVDVVSVDNELERETKKRAKKQKKQKDNV